MKALHDSEAHARWIDVVDPPGETVDGADDDTFPILPHYDDHDRLIGIELLGADTVPEAQIVDALTDLDLDIPTLLAAWRAGPAAPDREVMVDPVILA
ncbi:MAG: hypothetical protein FJW92_04910 [Actinobacteria bacterium]|nr:hypothetical protein [Actinomycetota bacterium]